MSDKPIRYATNNLLEASLLTLMAVYNLTSIKGIEVNEAVGTSGELEPFVSPNIKFVPIRSAANVRRGLLGHLKVTLPGEPTHSIQIQTWTKTDDRRLLRIRRTVKQFPILDESKLLPIVE